MRATTLLAALVGLGCGFPELPDATPQKRDEPEPPKTELPPAPPLPVAPARPPTQPEPPKLERPPVEPHVVTGKWRIREFEIEIDPPADAWLASFDEAFGLDLELGDRKPFSINTAIDIGTNCEGRCVPSEAAERIQKEGADRIFSNTSRDAKDVHWEVRPTEFEPGRWWMHLRGVDESGRKVLERIEVATIVPESKRGWFRCGVTVREADLARTGELIEFCKGLRPRYVGEDRASVESRFENRYVIDGVELQVPTPPDFYFRGYHPKRDALEYRSKPMGEISLFSISTSCYGMCVPDKLLANIKERDAERPAELKEQGRVFEVVKPLTEVKPNRWVRRIHFPKVDRFAESIELDVFALHPGAERFLLCDAKLEATQLEKADAFEERCLKILEPW